MAGPARARAMATLYDDVPVTLESVELETLRASLASSEAARAREADAAAAAGARARARITKP
jgi:hypothetical protein